MPGQEEGEEREGGEKGRREGLLYSRPLLLCGHLRAEYACCLLLCYKSSPGGSHVLNTSNLPLLEERPTCLQGRRKEEEGRKT